MKEGKCYYCKRFAPLTRDHVVPLSRGGTKLPGNIVYCCRPCNSTKGHWLLTELPERWYDMSKKVLRMYIRVMNPDAWALEDARNKTHLHKRIKNGRTWDRRDDELGGTGSRW